jgi:hypothetical protein
MNGISCINSNCLGMRSWVLGFVKIPLSGSPLREEDWCSEEAGRLTHPIQTVKGGATVRLSHGWIVESRTREIANVVDGVISHYSLADVHDL